MEDNNKMKYIFHNISTSNAPQYIERVSRGGYIIYGEDNNYPSYLLSLMNNSAKHNSILKRKAMLVGGNGWNIDGIDGIAAQFIANPYNEMNLNEIVFRSAYDLELFGAFSLEIIYSKDRTKIAELNYIPTNKVRIAEDNKNIFISSDWQNLRKFAPIKYPIYNIKNPIGQQILYVKEYRPGSEYYGQPEYLSAVNWIDLEYKVSCFHLNQVETGFFPSMVINFTTVPSDDEMKDVVRQLKADFQGAQGETVMFLFSDGIDNAAQITPITLNNSDERFIELNKEITEGILTGHGFPKALLSTNNADNTMFAKNEVLESLEVFQSMYVNEKQKLIETVYNNLLKFNGSQTLLKLNKYELDITKINEPIV